MMICSSISGILSMSSNILPKMVFSPIFNNGFGKFFVSSPNLVAYPAAITIFFMFLPFAFWGSLWYSDILNLWLLTYGS